MIMDKRGATNIPQIHILEQEMRIHSRLNIAGMPVI
jgi:hypothetical protein